MTDPFRCICDPGDLFEPPDPTPRAVKDCPAHRARYVAQNFDWGEAKTQQVRPVEHGRNVLDGYDCPDHPWTARRRTRPHLQATSGERPMVTNRKGST